MPIERVGNVLLDVRGMSVYYNQVCALDQVDLEVMPGDIVAVIGSNGAGKTTLLKSIMRLVKARHSSVHLNGQDISRLRPYQIVRMGMTLVPEGRHVFPYLTVWDNLLLGSYGLPRRIRKERAESVTDVFPILRERKNQIASLLSGGEQQMLAIARAMMLEPELLLLDEPSMGLSPKMVEEIYEKIVELNARGTTILLVDQNAELALDVCRRGYVLATGRIVARGTREEIHDNDIIRRSYLG